ncbi:RNA polymerase sigma factor [Pseudonocardia sediminis]|uniref:RNA polymerase sigma factor n=1 Tax=Pseudonocardia sediminis TaxID=1397368 RepID=UPI001F5F33AD|nr:sigma-70 family RNA polymerase sigma factor [Pseudonocardia sediminis]
MSQRAGPEPRSAAGPEPGPASDEAERRLRAHLASDLDAGFAALVREHQRVVHSVARQFSRDRSDAEDLAAEAFLRAYRALRGYDAGRLDSLRLRPWLLTILRNTARNAARDRARRPDPPPAFETAEEPADGASVEQEAESADVQRELGALLAQLPEVQRTAVVLRHVVGLGTAEVAEVLGCPEGTAKSHVSRGLARLRPLAEERLRPAAANRSGLREEGRTP